MNTTSASRTSAELVEALARFGPAYLKWLSAGVSGTTYARMRLLRALHGRGPQIMSALGECLAVTPRNITMLVDGLETEQLVRRVPHPDDRRATIVELTDAGRQVLSETFAVHSARAAKLFETLTPDEQATLLHLVRRLTDELVARGEVDVCAVHIPT
jgi:DNA-binding MarR family transcriptional regulator